MESRAAQLVPPVPKEYAGKWIAWNWERTTIIASGAARADVRKAALATGEQRPIIDKVPDPNRIFLGGHSLVR